MATSDLRKVKEVNGWKINHPHSAANVFYAIFTLVAVAFPLAFLFIPLIANDPMLNGLDIFRFFIEFMQGMFKGDFHPEPSNMIIKWVVDNVRPDLWDAVYYMFVGISMAMIVFMAMSLLKFVVAIIHLARGYLKNSGAVVGISNVVPMSLHSEVNLRSFISHVAYAEAVLMYLKPKTVFPPTLPTGTLITTSTNVQLVFAAYGAIVSCCHSEASTLPL